MAVTKMPELDATQARTKKAISIIAVWLVSLIGTIAAIAQIIDYTRDEDVVLWQTFGIILICLGVTAGIHFALKGQWQSLACYALGLILVLSGSMVLMGYGIAGSDGSCTASDTDPNILSGRSVLPTREDYSDTAIIFCRVDINGGRKIVSDYSISGSIQGRLPAGEQLGILRYTDPSTCDRKGSPGTGGYWLKRRLAQKDLDHPWVINDSIGYPEALTIRRIFYYVLASPEGLDQIQRDNDDNKGKSNYGGLLRLPQTVRRVASFPLIADSPISCEPK
jgi:hypothetical protein